MTPDDYQKVKEIFQSVLEIEPEGRGAFLDEKCSSENGLRDEVERLLRSYDSEFLETPAAESEAESVAGRSLAAGHSIGHYTILRKIGSGGMGEIYLAEDGKLGRKVAIKLLPETFTEDADRLRRFEQEARTASSLNHPNILTVHEIGETRNSRYIATEFIDGETLRTRLNRGKLSISEALDIAVQCASALTATHTEGIIHRDIKPENIMLRRDNLVKVLDFGLAKLSEPLASSGAAGVSHDAPTERHVKTAPGVIMGTVQYMSPEQTRGHATDARTDIWSLGVVIYEMLAGQPPFTGGNSADLIAEIVKTNPSPPSHYDSTVPERLDEIVGKSMEKISDQRYQTVEELFIDLRRLKRIREARQEMQLSSATDHSTRSSFDAENAVRITDGESAEPTSPQQILNANDIDSGDSFKSRPRSVDENKQAHVSGVPPLTSRRKGLIRGLKALVSGFVVAFTFLVLLHVLQIASIAIFENQEKLSPQEASSLIEMIWRLLELVLVPIGFGYFLGIGLILFGIARMIYALFERGYTSPRALLIERIFFIVILLSISAIAIPNLIASRSQALRIRDGGLQSR